MAKIINRKGRLYENNDEDGYEIVENAPRLKFNLNLICEFAIVDEGDDYGKIYDINKERVLDTEDLRFVDVVDNYNDSLLALADNGDLFLYEIDNDNNIRSNSKINSRVSFISSSDTTLYYTSDDVLYEINLDGPNHETPVEGEILGLIGKTVITESHYLTRHGRDGFDEYERRGRLIGIGEIGVDTNYEFISNLVVIEEVEDKLEVNYAGIDRIYTIHNKFLEEFHERYQVTDVVQIYDAAHLLTRTGKLAKLTDMCGITSPSIPDYIFRTSYGKNPRSRI